MVLMLRLVQCKDSNFLGDRVIENRIYNKTQHSTLHVFVAEYEPYFYRKNGVGPYCGIEYFLINTIATKLNLTISFHPSTREALSNHWEPLSR